MTTDAQELVALSDAARLRKTMLCSQRSFHNSCLSWIPILGLWFGPRAMVLGIRAFWSRGNHWNPLEREAQFGILGGFVGTLVSLMLLLHSRSGNEFLFNELHWARGVGAIFLMTVFAAGLAVCAQFARLGPTFPSGQKAFLIGFPTLIWTAVFLGWLTDSNNAPEGPWIIAYWLLVISPIVILSAAIVSKPVNEFFHQRPAVPILCIACACGLISLGLVPGRPNQWLTHPSIDDVLLAICIAIPVVATANIIEQMLRQHVRPIRSFSQADPVQYSAYVFAGNVHLSVTTIVIVVLSLM